MSSITENDSIISDEITDTEYNNNMLNTEDVVDEDDNNNFSYSNISIKKEKVIVDNDKRISKNRMTYYEFVRIIGERKKQLTMGAKPLIKINPKSSLLTYEEIAIEELKNKMIPFKIKRPVKNHIEIWSIDELDVNHLTNLF
jgi:DNA-directed RNA polymerase subunit K/omega